MFFNIFSIILLAANIYCFKTKKYLYLFIPCMLFLPQYYGIDFSSSLPVLTGTRIMFIVFYIYVFMNKRRTIEIKNIRLKEIPVSYYFLAGFFLFRLVTNFRYVFTYSDAAKTIFEILFEQVFFLIALYMLAPTKDEIITLIKVLVWTSLYIFITGLIESFTFFNMWGLLYNVSRNMLNSFYIRLGLLRIASSMGLPNFFGNFCIFVLPLILYLRKKTGQRRYLIVLFFDFLAIIHSGCRSDLIFFVMIYTAYLVLGIKSKKNTMASLKDICLVLAMVVIWASIFSIASTNYKYYYTGTAKSMLNLIGFNYDLNEGAPAGVEGYGHNDDDATYSRSFQLSGIKYAMSVNPLFGLGSGAHTRGDIIYTFYTKQVRTRTIDLGIVEILACEGVIGLLGFISLALGILVLLKNSMPNSLENELSQMKILLVLAFILSTLSTGILYPYLTMIIAIWFLPT